MHKSLANQDKIQALIDKQKALSYPFGQDIAAVEHEYRMRHEGKDDAVSIINVLRIQYLYIDNVLQYIQDVHNDGENIMIICFYRRQIEVFMQQNWFQCDMAFKRLKDRRQKEIVFAMMNKQNNKSR